MEVDCFEPNSAECARLQRQSPTNVHWFPVALAGNTGRRNFYVLNRATGSSLLPPNDSVILEYSGESYAGVARVTEIDCLSLSDFLTGHSRPTPSLIKLDTQGSELEILSSLTPAQLDAVMAVEVEVEFLELYQGQPSFFDVHQFMQNRGFRLLDLRTHRSYRNAHDRASHYLRANLKTASGTPALSAELVAGDALYFRDPPLAESRVSYESLVRSLFLLRVYQFFDLAFWLVDKARQHGVVTPTQHDALLRDLAFGAPRPTPWQREGTLGAASRRVLAAFALNDREVFWTRRNWPDQ